MLLKGFLAAAALTASITASAGYILNVQFMEEDSTGGAGSRGGGDTLALAPISLGNPSAAATLSTRWPGQPNDTSLGGGRAPSFQYPLRIGPGDTLAGLLTGAGVSRSEAQAAIKALATLYNPRFIRLGQRIAVRYTPHAPGSAEARLPSPGHFQGLLLEPDYDVVIRVDRTEGNGFSARRIEKRLRRAPVRAEGVIQSSLYVDGLKAGIPHPVLAELIRAYSWDVDFQRDIRKGDGFEVMYERAFDLKGRLVYSGNIQFAALTLSGKRHAIYLYQTADGTRDYFDEKGQSARKALMRTPIDGARLTSGFGRRKHPILGYTKLHRGVDFAAPRGTPIYAAGNGTVQRAGRNGAYGLYVKIRHNGRYSTAYAHMRAIARGARRGKRVTQGQIIGYVGSTGRSTGPHLHYEILAGGVRTNPMRVKMPSGKKLKGDELEDFQVARNVLDERYWAIKPEPKTAAKPTGAGIGAP